MTKEASSEGQQEVRLPYREEVTLSKVTPTDGSSGEPVPATATMPSSIPGFSAVQVHKLDSMTNQMSTMGSTLMTAIQQLQQQMQQMQQSFTAAEKPQSNMPAAEPPPQPVTPQPTSEDKRWHPEEIGQFDGTGDVYAFTDRLSEALTEEDRPPYRKVEISTGPSNLKTADELKQLREDRLRRKKSKKRAMIDYARARRNEEEPTRKAQELKQKQEKTAYMKQNFNEIVEAPTNKQVGLEEAGGLDEALGFLKPPVDLVARRTDMQLQPEVLP